MTPLVEALLVYTKRCPRNSGMIDYASPRITGQSGERGVELI